MDASLPERQYFGRYETLFPIATGGMAEVYAARVIGEAGFQKLVALKRMRPELAEDARFVAMFLDEGRMAANISSPNVVTTLDLGRADDNSLYLVMELVTGVSLAVIIEEAATREQRIPVGIAVEIIAQAACGLHDAHEARTPTGVPLGIVHRDCSPHNILVDVGGQVKITDFGIAKAMERQTTSQAGEVKGKLSYLSPEQARGDPVDRRVDVFILGIVAWELIAQRRLFDGSSAVEALHKVTAMPIPRLDEVREDVPERVADAVAQALVRDVDERFATCLAFSNALRSASPERPSRAEISAFVRANAGDLLAEIERKIRLTFATQSRPPPPAASAVPAPRVATMGQPDEPSTPPPMEIPPDTVQMNTLQLAGLERLEKYPSAPRLIDLLTPDTIPETDLEAAELERLRHPDPLPEAGSGLVAKLPGLRDDPTEPELRSDVGAKRRGVSGSIAPPAMDLEPDRLRETKRGSLAWMMIALAVVVAGGGGAVAAWWVRANHAADREVPDVEAPASDPADPGEEPPPEESAPPEAPDPPPVMPTPPHAEVQEALGTPEPAAPPRTRRARRRRRHIADPVPGTVSGSRPPEGDRQAAFNEIPW